MWMGSFRVKHRHLERKGKAIIISKQVNKFFTMDDKFIKDLISAEIAGKNNAIHAYDKMIWTVRTGYLTLVFAAWSLVIKAGIDQEIDPGENKEYLYILSAFSLVLAIGGYNIDLNYAKRKFRIIKALNELMEILCKPDLGQMDPVDRKKLTRLMQVSGDAANQDYRQRSFNYELSILRIIYVAPLALIAGILVFYSFIY